MKEWRGKRKTKDRKNGKEDRRGRGGREKEERVDKRSNLDIHQDVLHQQLVLARAPIQ